MCILSWALGIMGGEVKNKIIFHFLLLIFLLSNQVFGHNNEVVHPDILTGKAVFLTTTTRVGYDEFNEYYRRDGVKNDIRDGTIDADELNPYIRRVNNPVSFL